MNLSTIVVSVFWNMLDFLFTISRTINSPTDHPHRNSSVLMGSDLQCFTKKEILVIVKACLRKHLGSSKKDDFRGQDGGAGKSTVSKVLTQDITQV